MPNLYTHSTILRSVRLLALAAALPSALMLASAPVSAQGGTVAVTGDGSGSFLRPSVGGDTKDMEATPKDKKAGKASKAKKGTETASRDAGMDSMSGDHAITALVNDEPVTGFEVDRRAMMLGGASVQQQAKSNFEAIVKNPKTSERLKAILNEVVEANQGKSRDEIIAIFERRKKEFGMSMQRQALENARKTALPAVKKQALEELIDEKLKLQEAKKQSVAIEDAEVDRVITGIAQRNKMTMEQFAQQLGGSIDPMKNRIRAALSWNEVVRRRFGPLININNRDVDKMVASASGAAQQDTELQIQRISITLPKKMEEHGVAQRLQDAEKIRSRFTDCKSTATAATGVAGAKFEQLGKRRTSSIPEPTRTLLLNAHDGEMLPPSVEEGEVQLWVVCGRDAVAGDADARTKVEGELKQKEFEVMAQRYLKDLREDAHIEYR
ncbi:peptidylprolyl isomerase [Hyphomicrobium methylovorum]|uniref:SurA N-terminal domain-containing protein n=1 Tax=Hyphomicrobium methylovorum TaxID=84 RepID=UPI0015E78D88|nr:SurA N-terminal domain-containing protein [Hyphomicrobium methylovorum]MBA2127760.1 peptidylprolyl isomerase [Hyphomicrobium methylovorum]